MSILASRPFGSAAAGLATVLVPVLLAGCSTLPSSGPTAGQVVKRALNPEGKVQFKVVPLDASAIARLNTEQEQRIASAVSLATMDRPKLPLLIGPGDVLTISLYEVGVGLFGGPSNGDAAVSGAFINPSAHDERFPNIVVGDAGDIRLPYAGDLEVAGHTPQQVEAAIEQKLARLSQKPQAMVTVQKNVSNSVYVLGDANKPGRYELSYNRQRLLDAIADASGSSASAEDSLVQLERDGRMVEQRLGTITPVSRDNVILQPGDRINIIKRPRTFSVLGATSKVSQVSFETGSVSLAEAIARVAGPNDSLADPTAIFVFRYTEATLANDSQPVIYRLNMMEPSSYFLAQRFTMQDKDVIYIANARANQPSKLIGIINQLFGPVVTARALSQ